MSAFTPDPGPYYSTETGEVISQQTKKVLARCYGKDAASTARLLASVFRLVQTLSILEHLESTEWSRDYNDEQAAYKLGLIQGALMAAGLKTKEVP